MSPASIKISLFNFLAPKFFDYFAIEFTVDISTLVGRLNTSVKLNINLPNCTIFKNWVFESFIYVMKHLQKLYKFLKPVHEFTIIYVEN